MATTQTKNQIQSEEEALDAEMTALYEAYFEQARKSGCPEDQMENFAKAEYIAFEWQLRFHAAAREADFEGGPVDIGLGGARGPGKSHGVLSQVALDDCQRAENLKCLFLRQTGRTAAESFDDLINKAVRGRVEFHKTQSSILFPDTGSRILLGGFKDEKDIDKYIGIEYDIIIVEELNQLTEEKYTKLRGSLRTSKSYWRPRMYTSFNPGGIGHTFVKNRYVIPYRNELGGIAKQTETRFIPSTYKENAALNLEYIEYLESIGGDLGKAWREGEWDLFAGMYFEEWRYDRHVVKAFEIPFTWLKFRSIDPSGRSGTTSCHWYAVNGDGRVYVYREHYAKGMDIDQHAKEIFKLSHDEYGVPETYQYTVIDTAAFAKAGYSETTAEIYQREGVAGLIESAKERVVGWNAVHQYLRWEENDDHTYTQPKLQVFENCVKMIETIPLLIHDRLHPEDVDTNGDDHAADELRYFLRTLRGAEAPKAETAIQRRLKSMRERNNTRFDYQYRRN